MSGREMSSREMSGREVSGQEMSWFWQKRMMQFWWEIQISGEPDGPYPPDGAGAAGVHLGGGASIRSSSGGQDEAIDTPTTLLPGLEVQNLSSLTVLI